MAGVWAFLLTAIAPKHWEAPKSLTIPIPHMGLEIADVPVTARILR